MPSDFPYDVFLSYIQADKAWGRRLAERLLATGFKLAREVRQDGVWLKAPHLTSCAEAKPANGGQDPKPLGNQPAKIPGPKACHVIAWAEGPRKPVDVFSRGLKGRNKTLTSFTPHVPPLQGGRESFWDVDLGLRTVRFTPGFHRPGFQRLRGDEPVAICDLEPA
jgi:hypothetical protein